MRQTTYSRLFALTVLINHMYCCCCTAGDWTIRVIVKKTLTAIVVAFALSGCVSTSQPADFRADIREDKPYPAVANLKLDGIPFGFRIRFRSGRYQMDLPATVNFMDNDASEAMKVLEALDTSFPSVIKKPSGTYITFSGMSKGQDSSSSSRIEYNLQVDDRGVLLEFQKEISVHNWSYLMGPPITADDLLQPLFKAYGIPHSEHSEIHEATKCQIDTYWWGVDERVLSKGGTYDSLNAHWVNRFLGKVIRANLYKYKSGDITLRITMTDNYKWFMDFLR